MNCIYRPLKLYVIGNGFDLHHGMPCGYVDFIAWLQGRSGDGSLIRSIGIVKPSPDSSSLTPLELALAA
jgi:hypothetical protein